MTKDGDRRLLDAIPTGLRSRARATGRIALSIGRRGASRLFGGGAAADERLGAALLGELDQLKGMAMKVGQILSYMDVGFPPEVTAQLAQLRTGVTPMPIERIAPVVEAALGRPIDACFANFDPVPIAAASIGQVHRATTFDNQRVAVKVRYPGIRETMEGDFAQLERLGALAGTFTAVDGRALVEELFARVVEECDYDREADWQRRFYRFFANDPAITVPRVLDELCGDAVLTTTFSEGMGFDEFCASASPAARDAASVALLRFAYAPLFEQGYLHADPHPGNQLYDASGRIVALDFGCVRAFEPAFVDKFRSFCRAVLEEDREAFRSLAIELGLAPRPERIDFDELWRLYHWLFAPVRTPRFEFSADWWEAGRAFTRPSAKNARHQGFPPEWIWVQRVQWSLWAVLKRIGGRADLTAPFAALLDNVDRAAGSAGGPLFDREARVA